LKKRLELAKEHKNELLYRESKEVFASSINYWEGMIKAFEDVIESVEIEINREGEWAEMMHEMERKTQLEVKPF